MTSSSFGAMEVFQPFREARADKGKVHYTSSGGRGLMNSMNGSTRTAQQNLGMMMSSTTSGANSSSGAAVEDYSPSLLSQPYPLLSMTGDSSSRQTRNSVLIDARSDPGRTAGNRSSSGAMQRASGTTNASSSSASTMRTSASLRPTSKSLEDDSAGDIMIEEKRRRPNGDGYTVHKYLRGRMLGKGGFAKVYLCTAMDTGKNYAVKVVCKANLVKARARQKLQAEIKIHRTLKHRHICQYKHYFEDRNNCYILLELCHNQSLNEMIKRRKRFTEPEAAYFFGQLTEAVRYMHEHSVIHRDLKLGNLFLDQNLHVKVGDFGLATRVEDRDEKRKTICGTPNYIAPEVIQGDKTKRGHSFEVDIWSMGVILYTILVGKPPYEAKDVKATYHRILANEYSFPDHADLSWNVKDLIRSMLQSNPKDRPSLDFVESHPFLMAMVPIASLPSSVLHRAPLWRTDDFGILVLDEEESASQHPTKAMLPRSNSLRQPFASRNPNVSKKDGLASQTKKEQPGRGVIDMPRVVKTAMTLSTKPSSVSASPGFQIFDESKSSATPSTSQSVSSGSAKKRPTTLSEETIITRTKALSLGPPSSTCDSLSPAPDYSANVENDADVLRKMVDQLDTVLSIAQSRKGSYLLHSPRTASSRGGPVRWITRYVDYTSKYGLGFLLNDGCSGVYFNDSTKTALGPSGETFQYIERKRDDKDLSDRGPDSVVVETYTLCSYPDSLKKKVTLLTHFRNYLLEQQKKEEPVVSVAGNNVADLIYVKKWIQTKHAILFRLSDQTIQVVFYDQTEVLLTPDTRFVTYVDKSGRRATYHFTDELVGSSNEMEKRLKYTKEIMLQLISGQRR